MIRFVSMKKDIELIFSRVSDPRVKGRCDHLLCDILFIALCTLLSNSEDFEDMVEFGKQRRAWLKKADYLLAVKENQGDLLEEAAMRRRI